MKVILLQDIKSLGKKFEVKAVKDGYGRNFLLPKGLAKIATEQALKELAIQKAVWEKKEKELQTKLEELAKSLNDQEFHFTVQTGKKGEVFGSVSKEDIKEKLPIKDCEINLERPLKDLGEHSIEINLGRGTKTTIRIIIESLPS